MQSRKQSRDVPLQQSAKLTPKVGLTTRLLIESLDRVPFTPSQGICTPSPTNMATMLVHHHHHHHHVYGNGTQQLGDQEINDAYMAGLAAGRADALERVGHRVLIPAVYDSPSRTLGLHGDSGNSDGHGQIESSPIPPESVICCDDDDDAHSVAGILKDDPSKKYKIGNGIDMEQARQVALAICAAEGVYVTEGQEIPGELVALGSLMITLDIPVQLAMCPASEFSSPKKGARHYPLANKKLNARQRRTLRRAQERAWKELETMPKKRVSSIDAPQVYSPTCMTYGVNPTAFSDYNFMMMHHSTGSGVPPSPTHVAGFGYPRMAPVTGSGVIHHQQQQTRALSRFAQQKVNNNTGNKPHY